MFFGKVACAIPAMNIFGDFFFGKVAPTDTVPG